ncbi:hypothetical protein R3P38DRAFT_2368749, partial [Favolaschia claudopus]
RTPGEIEATFMKATARAANLKAIIADNPTVRNKVSEAINAYEHLSGKSVQGFKLTQILDPDDTRFDRKARSQWGALSLEERQILHSYLTWRYGDFNLEIWQASASIMDQISIQGVSYAKENVLKYDRDSHIIFNIPGTQDTAPGKIKNIFQYWHTTPAGVEIKAIYLIVDSFNPHPIPEAMDPFRRYGSMAGFLSTSQPMERRVIEAGHVRSHFGQTPLESDGVKLMHVLPLSRVCFYFLHNVEKS